MQNHEKKYTLCAHCPFAVGCDKQDVTPGVGGCLCVPREF